MIKNYIFNTFDAQFALQWKVFALVKNFVSCVMDGMCLLLSNCVFQPKPWWLHEPNHVFNA